MNNQSYEERQAAKTSAVNTFLGWVLQIILLTLAARGLIDLLYWIKG